MITVWSDLYMLPCEQFMIEAHGVRTRVVQAGDGPPLVFLHGIAGTLEAHMPAFPALARHFRLIAYDMPGRGWSDKPDCPYTIDYLSDHLVALLDALAIEQVSLSGQSLGGWVAAWTAAHHPERVKKLILNNPGNVRSRPEALAKVRASNLRQARYPSLDEVRERFAWLFHDRSKITDEMIWIRYACYSQPGFARAMEHISSILVPEIRQHYAWSQQWCSKIAAPTLLLWSDHNPIAAREDGQILLDWIPHIRLEQIGGGEFPQYEETERFNRIHLEFLKESQ